MPVTGGGAAGGEIYVDRGDPSAWDWQIGDLTADGTWNDLDCSSIVTDSDATRISIRYRADDNVTGKWLGLRENGNSNIYNTIVININIANKWIEGVGEVSCDSNQVIEYMIEAGVDAVDILVKGWWKPA